MDDTTELSVVDGVAAPSDSLVFRDDAGVGRRFCLPSKQDRVIVGRSVQCGLSLPWDREVSRAHAELLRIDGRWLIKDDKMSRNGTRVNGQRLAGGHWLADDDRILVGKTQLTFRRWLSDDKSDETEPGGERVEVTAAQLLVLRALCRPVLTGTAYSLATNKEIARELSLSEDTVKDHLKELYRRFRLDNAQAGARRQVLAQRAQQCGLV